MSLRWSSYVAPKPPKWGSKMRNGRFPSKIALRLKKVCYKVSLCKNCQRRSCKAFIGLTICAKMISGGQPLLAEILDKTDRIWAKSLIFDLTSSGKSLINTNRKSTKQCIILPTTSKTCCRTSLPRKLWMIKLVAFLHIILCSNKRQLPNSWW